jgi:hypothetical protein
MGGGRRLCRARPASRALLVRPNPQPSPTGRLSPARRVWACPPPPPRARDTAARRFSKATAGGGPKDAPCPIAPTQVTRAVTGPPLGRPVVAARSERARRPTRRSPSREMVDARAKRADRPRSPRALRAPRRRRRRRNMERLLEAPRWARGPKVKRPRRQCPTVPIRAEGAFRLAGCEAPGAGVARISRDRP